MSDAASRLDLDLLRRHSGFVRALARSLTRDEAAADDVAQEVWLTALERPPKHERSIAGWLAAVTRNVARQTDRSTHRRAERERARTRTDAKAATGGRSPLDTLEEIELLGRLLDAIRSLSEVHREAILLRYYEGRSPREIAKRTATPVETVKKRLQRALAELRRRLDDLSGGERAAWCAPLVLLAAPRPGPMAAGASVVTKGVLAVSTSTKVLSATLLTLAAILVFFLTAFREPGQGSREAAPERAEAAIAERADAGAALPVADGARVEGPSVELPPLAADRELDLFGIVVDGDGAPVPGATIEAVRYPWLRFLDLLYEIRDTEEVGPESRSRADGQFALRLEPGDQVHLRVRKTGYATTTLAYRVAGEKVRVVLARSSAIEARVVGADGGAVAGAKVRAWRRDEHSEPFGMLSGVSNAEGRVRFEDMAPGSISVGAEHPDYGPGMWQDVVVEATEGGDAEVEIRLSGGNDTRGRVTDALTGLPIANARVGIGPFFQCEVRTDDDGRFRLAGIPASSWDLQVDAAGYEMETRRPPGEGETVEFTLVPGTTVRGRLVDTRGKPISGAHVIAVGVSPDRYDDFVDRRAARSHRDGRFELAGLRRNIAHTLIVDSRGHGRMLLDFASSSDDETTHDLGDVTVPDARRVGGTLSDATGAPQPRARITLEGQNDGRRRLTGRERDAVPPYLGRKITTRTDDLGRYRFRDVAPGSYDLVVQGEGVDELLRRSVTVTEGSDVAIDLRLEPRYGLAIRVVDPGGYGVAHASVRVGPEWMQSDEDGFARFENLEAREINVHVSAVDGYVDARRQVIPSGQEVVVELVPSAVVEGRLVAPNGVGLKHFRIVARKRNPGRSQVSDQTDESGRFAIDAEAGDVLDLELDWGRGSRPPYRASLDGVTAPATGIVLEAEPLTYDCSLTVRFVDPDGRPVPGLSVRIESELTPNEAPGAGVTDADGRVRFAELSEAPVRVVLDDDRYPPPGFEPTVPVLVPPPSTVVADNQEIELRFRVRGEVVGEVVDENDIPVQGARVILRAEDGEACHGVTGSDGRFRIAAPVGEAYRVGAARIGAAPGPQVPVACPGSVTLRIGD